MLFLFCERVFDSFCLRVLAVSYIFSKKKRTRLGYACRSVLGVLGIQHKYNTLNEVCVLPMAQQHCELG